MRAIFDGQDYTLVLDREAQEISQLSEHVKLEAQLMGLGNADLGKIASLEYAENNAIDGIELTYFPDGAESWDAIQRIQVKIDNRACSNVRLNGHFGTRYNGSDKIDILNGMQY